jgi:putative colanic acid biosynthesis acetyltransferase WcaF
MADLSAYDNRDYDPGAGLVRRALWYLVNAVFFASWLHLGSRFKCALLRAFGAALGAGVVIKPRVNIKQPWRLAAGDHVWIGEGAWLDNLAPIALGSHVCISQGAYLVTGSHDYTDPAFALIVKPIAVEDGAWIGARALVCPGVTVGAAAVLTAGSVLSRDAEPGGVYRGNPAEKVRERRIRPAPGGGG